MSGQIARLPGKGVKNEDRRDIPLRFHGQFRIRDIHTTDTLPSYDILAPNLSIRMEIAREKK